MPGLVSSGELTLRLYWSWFHTIGSYNNGRSQAQGAPLKSSYLLVPVGPAIRLVDVTCAHKICKPPHSRLTTTVAVSGRGHCKRNGERDDCITAWNTKLSVAHTSHKLYSSVPCSMENTKMSVSRETRVDVEEPTGHRTATMNAAWDPKL